MFREHGDKFAHATPEDSRIQGDVAPAVFLVVRVHGVVYVNVGISVFVVRLNTDRDKPVSVHPVSGSHKVCAKAGLIGQVVDDPGQLVLAGTPGLIQDTVTRCRKGGQNAHHLGSIPANNVNEVPYDRLWPVGREQATEHHVRLACADKADCTHASITLSVLTLQTINRQSSLVCEFSH